MDLCYIRLCLHQLMLNDVIAIVCHLSKYSFDFWLEILIRFLACYYLFSCYRCVDCSLLLDKEIFIHYLFVNVVCLFVCFSHVGVHEGGQSRGGGSPVGERLLLRQVLRAPIQLSERVSGGLDRMNRFIILSML